MRALQRLTIAALLIAALAIPGTGPAAGHDRETRDTREVRDTHETERRDRDADRDRRDAERQRHDRDESKDRSQSARDDEATQDSKDTADSPTGDSAASKSSDSDSDGSGSNSGSSGSNTSGSNTSGSNTSGSNSGSSGTSGSSGSGSNSGSSNSGSDGGDDNEESSGSNSGSSNSGSDDDDERDDDSGSNSGSSNSGSDDDDDDDGDDSDDERQIAGAGDARRIDVETDTQGRERRRGEFLVRGGREVADALRTAGFRTLSSRHLSNLNASVVRVEVRAGSTMEADIAYARRLAGTEEAEPNYLFRLSGAASSLAALATAPTQSVSAETGVRVGVVDTGADGQAPALRDRIAAARGFGGPYTARTHGTYVAQILARENIRVEVADVFQADAQGAPVATAESIARGIDWLAARRIPVVNVSITGPNSGVLSAVVARAIERGTVVIAAAGNDGPAAPPVYPAAFANVVGVTAVDQDGRVYRRANRGQHVDFAALGVRVPVTGANGGVEYVSGTSYAAPLIAAAFARRYTQQRPGGAVAEIARMQNAAIDLGERGRDPVFGWGRVSTSETQR